MMVVGTTQAQQYDIPFTLSDGAQSHTIAFDGLAFITGDFCRCSFVPPGKVADYFGFQYLRDNDITHSGHNSSFSEVIANNLLHVLDSTQKQKLVTLAIAQVPLVDRYAIDRFPLIDAFVRLKNGNIPAGVTGLDSTAVKEYSAQLYQLDGRISFQRAKMYAEIIDSLNTQQRHYLDSVKVLGMLNMPVLPLQIDKTHLNNKQFVQVMSYADDIFSWYMFNDSADVYFCPERQGDYFGGFYLKDAPAMGNANYAIDTSLTQSGGQRFLNTLNTTQKALITQLTDSQRTDLYSIIDRRFEIDHELRHYLSGTAVDTNLIQTLSAAYGRLDGMISYRYATNFSLVAHTLTQVQRDTLDSIVHITQWPCPGAYLYSDTIVVPVIPNTDFLFGVNTGLNEDHHTKLIRVYPNPAHSMITVDGLSNEEQTTLTLVNAMGALCLRKEGTELNTSQLPEGVYLLTIDNGTINTTTRIIITH